MNDSPLEKNPGQQDASPGIAASIALIIVGVLIFFFPKLTDMPDHLATLAWLMYIVGLIFVVVGIVCLGTAIDKGWLARRRRGDERA